MVISWICQLCGLPPAPAEAKMMRDFCVALDPTACPLLFVASLMLPPISLQMLMASFLFHLLVCG